MAIKQYESLFTKYREQQRNTVFAHFHAIAGDYDEPFKAIARNTVDGYDSWQFQQKRFQEKYKNTDVPKLKNYLNYTFVRLVELENEYPGQYFSYSANRDWICFNTGLQNPYGSDLLVVFARSTTASPDRCDWIYRGCHAPSDKAYRDKFGSSVPEIAWYSKDSRDFVFNTSYELERDVFDHLFDRAKERAGMPHAHDSAVRDYLKGALENLPPKIRRNYKVAIPVYYVEEKRMQLLLPFYSVSDVNDVSCFLVERDDVHCIYKLKTIFDLDQAYFSARLITRPDRDWLNP